MRLIIARHGRTEENEKGILQGHMPGHLNDEGKRNAVLLGKYFSATSIDVMYSSDLQRAKDTVKHVAIYHTDIPVHYTRDLREQFLGDLEGQSNTLLQEKDDQGRLFWAYPPGGETTEDMTQRGMEFLHRCERLHIGETVFIMTHHGMARSLIAYMTKGDFHDLGRLGNTSFSILDMTKPGIYTLEVYNSVDHLKGTV